MLLLRFLRTSQHLSQSAIGALAQIPQPTLAHIELGRLKPTERQLRRLAAVFEVAPEELLRDVAAQ